MEGGVGGRVGGGDKQRRGNKGLSGLDENSEVGGGRLCEETLWVGGLLDWPQVTTPPTTPSPSDLYLL